MIDIHHADFPLWADFASATAGVITALAAIAGTVIGLVEFRRAKKLEFQDKRAFIIPRLEVNKDAGKRMVFLVVRNAGDTPAKNVILDFAEGQVWNWVRPANFPFLRDQGGLTALSPNSEMSFFVGEIRKDNTKFNDIESRDVFGVASFDHPTRAGRRIQDDFRLSLQDARYQSNPSSS